jgi:hydrogenase/urease accessory protein HupE
MRRIAAVLAALAVLLAPAFAHDSRPLFIEIADEAGAVSLRAVTPASVDAANAPSVRLGPPCAPVSERRRGARTIEADYRCESLAGVRLEIDWPAFNPSLTTIVRAELGDGEMRTAILEPDDTSWALPEPHSFAGVAQSYFVIGVEHIVFGVDHLLFLACLLFIAGTFRRAIVTATGFTLAHSLTLALVALDIVRVSVPAVEAVIALSIVFLAAEIARGDRTTIAWRHPAFVASVFGLVHGAGFAAALAEIGLPAGEKVAALLFFNLGVETGQVAIILGVFGAIAAVSRVVRAPARGAVFARPLGYALGVVAAFWFIERTAAIIAA